MNRAHTGGLAATLLLALAVHARAHFDRDRAKSNTEQMICGEPAGAPSLQWFDRKQARLFRRYSGARAEMDGLYTRAPGRFIGA